MGKSMNQPPFFAKKLLQCLTHFDDEFNLSCTLQDLYQYKVKTDGKFKADFWYWRQILCSLPKYHFTSFIWSLIMFKNYCKIALRNIKKHKAYSFINIAGLTAGLVCFIIISLWVRDELSFDQFHENKERLYKPIVQWENGQMTTTSSWALGPAMKTQIPEIEDFARVWFWHRSLVKYGDKRFDEENFYLADPSIFTMFSFPFVQGDPETVLSEMNSIVITRETAERYFGNEDPMGKVLQVVANEDDFIVTGVIENIPSNSLMQFDMVARIELMGERRLTSWEFTGYSFVMLREGVSINEINQKIEGFIRENADPEFTGIMKLQPFTQVHLYARGVPGLIQQVYTFSAVAILVLIIACVNFMNLSTAKASVRAKEVGMRKVSGARRVQLIRQFLGEAILYAFFAFILAIFISILLLPIFNEMTGKHLDLFHHPEMLLMLTGIVLFTGLIAGSYPAVMLSSLQPIQALKEGISRQLRGSFRKLLVVFQFIVSVGLFICIFVVSRQLDLLQNMDLGLNRDHVVMFRNNEALKSRFDAFSAELKRMPGIFNASASVVPPTTVGQAIFINWAKNSGGEPAGTNYTVSDYDFVETFDLELIQGRSFSRSYVRDAKEACIINETLANQLGLKSPVGEQITLEFDGFDESERQVKVIGVVKDFHFQSLRSPLGPFLLKIQRQWCNYVYVKIDGKDVQKSLKEIGRVFGRFSPDYPFDYEFLDDYYNEMYKAEIELGTLFKVFGGLALFISCMGLFGLSTFVAEQRTKEIGIRKVLGARVSSIVYLLSQGFTKLVLISNLIAWPVSYWLMKHWLQEFSYKITLSIDIFLVSAFLTLAIAVLSVGYQTVKAAVANPVDSLMYE